MKRLLSLDIKFSLSQAIYFASFAGLLGYATNYLSEVGLSASTIGIVLSIISVLACFTQPMIASFADKHKNVEIRYLVMVLMTIGTILALIMALIPMPILVVTVLFVGVSTALQTVMPLMNSLAFVFNKYGIEVNYGVARGIGSAGYAISAKVIGYLASLYGNKFIPFTYIILNILLVVVCYMYVIPKSEMHLVSQQENESQNVSQLSFVEFFKKYKKFMIMILAVVVVYFQHTIINNFMIKIVENIHGTSDSMGTAVFIAAIAELPAMFFFNPLREKFGCKTLLRVSAIMFVVKHVITYLASSMMMLYIAALTQGLAYALLIPAGVYYVNQVIDDNDAIKGQSMFTMAMTASGIIANIIGGKLMDISVSNTLLIGSVVSIVGAVIMFFGLEDIK